MRRRLVPTTVVFACLALSACGGGTTSQAGATATTSSTSAALDGPFCTALNGLAQPTVEAVSQTPPSVLTMGYLQRLQSQLATNAIQPSPKLAAAVTAVQSAVTKLQLQYSSAAALSADDLT